MKTIIGLYDDVMVARQVVEDLTNAGIRADHISLVVRQSAEDDDLNSGESQNDGYSQETDGAIEGALAGGIIGSLSGVILGEILVLAIPGVGPILAAGPLLAGLLGGGTGVIAGGLLGALTASGVPEEEATYYIEGVRQGGALIGAKVMEHQVDMVSGIMGSYHPVDIQAQASS